MEEKLLKCPNCGANATNHQNCEYCGSLLVRFVDKGIDLSQTCYLTNDEVIPGLIEELTGNLECQKEYPNENVTTEIYDPNGIDEKGTLSCEKVIQISNFPDQQGLHFDLVIPEYGEGWNVFSKLESYPLFTRKALEHNWAEYCINFGNDAEGAARLVSELLNKGAFHFDSIEMRTTYEPWNENNGDNEGDGIPNWVWAVGGVILFLLIKACS